MTDEQIVKALECCVSRTGCDACRGCPFNEDKLCDKDRFALEKHSLALIKRQQAEIDHLREATKKVKSDLKYYLDTNEENGVVWIPKFTINNLLKEMTEKEGGKG